MKSKRIEDLIDVSLVYESRQAVDVGDFRLHFILFIGKSQIEKRKERTEKREERIEGDDASKEEERELEK